MNKLLSSILFFFLAITSFSQVTGVVKDNDGNVLVGANVVWVGTNIGATTDIQGRFTLDRVADNNSLVTTFVGFTNDTTICKDIDYVEITLRGEITLDDVVVKAQRPMVMKAKGAQNIDVIGTAELCRCLRSWLSQRNSGRSIAWCRLYSPHML